jgi:hypothetical protein
MVYTYHFTVHKFTHTKKILMIGILNYMKNAPVKIIINSQDEKVIL